jgi:hypothetical protein
VCSCCTSTINPIIHHGVASDDLIAYFMYTVISPFINRYITFHLLGTLGVKDSKKMDLLSFEAVLDELSANMEDEDDMDGMEEMEADDIDDISSN